MTARLSTPWTSASDHGWEVLRRVIEVSDVIRALSDIAVGSVISILSSSSPSLIITPERPEDSQHINWLAREIVQSLGTDRAWLPVEQGPYWSLQLRHGHITISISTHVPVATPKPFEVKT